MILTIDNGDPAWWLCFGISRIVQLRKHIHE